MKPFLAPSVPSAHPIYASLYQGNRSGIRQEAFYFSGLDKYVYLKYLIPASLPHQVREPLQEYILYIIL